MVASNTRTSAGALLSLDNVAEAMQLRYCLAWVLRPLCSELGPAPSHQREFSPQLRASLFSALLAATDLGSPEKGIIGEPQLLRCEFIRSQSHFMFPAVSQPVFSAPSCY